MFAIFFMQRWGKVNVNIADGKNNPPMVLCYGVSFGMTLNH